MDRAHLSLTVALVGVVPVAIPIRELHPEAVMIWIIGSVGWADKAYRREDHRLPASSGGLEDMLLVVLDRDGDVLLPPLTRGQRTIRGAAKPAARYVDLAREVDLLLAGVLLEEKACYRLPWRRHRRHWGGQRRGGEQGKLPNMVIPVC